MKTSTEATPGECDDSARYINEYTHNFFIIEYARIHLRYPSWLGPGDVIRNRLGMRIDGGSEFSQIGHPRVSAGRFSR